MTNHQTTPSLAKVDGPPMAPPPSVDRAIYHGILGEIAQTAARTSEGDPVGIMATLMWGTGVLIGPEPHVMIANTRHPFLIWPLLFGRSGSGRKGEAHEAARVVLRRATVLYEDLRENGLSSGEGLIERIRDPNPDNEKDTGGTQDKRLLVEETEFKTVLARASREGNSLTGILRQAWEGGRLGNLTRTKLVASGSHIGIVGHITPKEFRARFDEADMAGGTYNRFLPIYVERTQKIALPAGMSEHEVREFGNRLRDAIQAAQKIGQVGLDEEAMALWCDELYDELTAADDDDKPWTQFARRAAPYCRRIAGLHAALAGKHRAGKGDLYAAAAMIRYAIASAEYVMDRSIRDPRLDRLQRAIDTAGTAGLTRAQVSALFSRKLNKEQLDGLIEGLLTSGQYEAVPVSTEGRTATVYRPAKKAK